MPKIHLDSAAFISKHVQATKTSVANAAPMNWAAMKPNTSFGAIPEKVSVKQQPMGTAGLAKEVDAVNQ